MYAAAFVEGCGLNAWQVNSIVTHAVSHDPVSAFTFLDVALPVWHHNPQALRAVDGTYVIYTIGMSPQGPVANCSHYRASEGPPPHNLTSTDHGFEVVQAWSSLSPYGPWTLLIVDPSAPYGELGNLINGTNPSPATLPNGTVLLASHNDGGLTLSTAPSWRGPYSRPVVVLPYAAYNDSTTFEDPFLWLGSDGLWHVLLHQYSKTSPHPQYRVGGYAHSLTSDPYGAWALQADATPAYTTLVQFADGTSTNFTRRERPKLLLNATSGEPEVLYTGVCPTDGSSCWTLAQSIAQAAGGA